VDRARAVRADADRCEPSRAQRMRQTQERGLAVLEAQHLGPAVAIVERPIDRRAARRVPRARLEEIRSNAPTLPPRRFLDDETQTLDVANARLLRYELVNVGRAERLAEVPRSERRDRGVDLLLEASLDRVGALLAKASDPELHGDRPSARPADDRSHAERRTARDDGMHALEQRGRLVRLERRGERALCDRNSFVDVRHELDLDRAGLAMAPHLRARERARTGRDARRERGTLEIACRDRGIHRTQRMRAARERSLERFRITAAHGARRIVDVDARIRAVDRVEHVRREITGAAASAAVPRADLPAARRHTRERGRPRNDLPRLAALLHGGREHDASLMPVAYVDRCARIGGPEPFDLLPQAKRLAAELARAGVRRNLVRRFLDTDDQVEAVAGVGDDRSAGELEDLARRTVADAELFAFDDLAMDCLAFRLVLVRGELHGLGKHERH